MQRGRVKKKSSKIERRQIKGKFPTSEQHVFSNVESHFVFV